MPREVSLNTSSTGESALALVQETLKLIEIEPDRVSAAIRNAVRIARLTNAYGDLFWLRYELVDSRLKISTSEVYAELYAQVTREQYDNVVELASERYKEERCYESKEGLLDKPKTAYALASIDEIEAAVISCRNSIIPGAKDKEDQARNLMTRHYFQQYLAVLARVRERVFNFLTKTEQRLLVGHANANIFDSYRRYVDQQLSRIAPEVLKQFAAIYRRIQEGDIEARSHALTSCRRIIKALADTVYPARDGTARGLDGKEYPLDEDHYVLRLRQYVSEVAAGHKSSEVLRAQIGDLESRFAALNGLASKGAHAQVTVHELNQCAIQTYLVAGDVFRLQAIP